MYCNKECPLFSWKMQDEVFSINIKLMKVGDCDMVLGMEWIDLFAPVIPRHTANPFKRKVRL